MFWKSKNIPDFEEMFAYSKKCTWFCKQWSGYKKSSWFWKMLAYSINVREFEKKYNEFFEMYIQKNIKYFHKILIFFPNFKKVHRFKKCQWVRKMFMHFQKCSWKEEKCFWISKFVPEFQNMFIDLKTIDEFSKNVHNFRKC